MKDDAAKTSPETMRDDLATSRAVDATEAQNAGDPDKSEMENADKVAAQPTFTPFLAPQLAPRLPTNAMPAKTAPNAASLSAFAAPEETGVDLGINPSPLFADVPTAAPQWKAPVAPVASTPEKDTPSVPEPTTMPAETTFAATPLDALLALAQAAPPQVQVAANATVEEPTGGAARPATALETTLVAATTPPSLRSDRPLVAASARQAGSPTKAVAPEQIDTLGPVAGTETGETRPDPVATPTFGEHLAKVTAEAVVQPPQGQGGDASAAAIRADLAPPALAPAPGLHSGTHGLTAAAAPHAATGAHPVVSGVPIQAVPVEIGLKSLAGINRFDIRLDPDDLGQIDVRLDISGEGHVKAHIVVERPEALLSLQRETSQLERALEQAGFRTGDEGVSMSLRQQNQGGSEERGGERGAGSQASTPRGDETPAEPQPIRRYSWGHASGIDRHV